MASIGGCYCNGNEPKIRVLQAGYCRVLKTEYRVKKQIWKILILTSFFYISSMTNRGYGAQGMFHTNWMKTRSPNHPLFCGPLVSCDGNFAF